MGIGSFLLGAVLGSTHVVEKRTTHEYVLPKETQ